MATIDKAGTVTDTGGNVANNSAALQSRVRDRIFDALRIG